jgi:hypothetical protein
MTDTTDAALSLAQPHRRGLLALLCSRAERGVLEPAEGPLLRALVAAEQDDADQAASLGAQLDDAVRDRDGWRATAEEQVETLGRRAEELRAALTSVLGRFTHETHPGVPCLQTGHIPVAIVRQWRAVLDGTGDAEPEHDGVKRAGSPFPMPDGAAEAYGAALPLTWHGDIEGYRTGSMTGVLAHSQAPGTATDAPTDGWAIAHRDSDGRLLCLRCAHGDGLTALLPNELPATGQRCKACGSDVHAVADARDDAPGDTPA